MKAAETILEDLEEFGLPPTRQEAIARFAGIIEICLNPDITVGGQITATNPNKSQGKLEDLC
jgi:hypothetical protein